MKGSKAVGCKTIKQLRSPYLYQSAKIRKYNEMQVSRSAEEEPFEISTRHTSGSWATLYNYQLIEELLVGCE